MIDQSRLHKMNAQQKKDWLLTTDVDGNRGSGLNDCEFDVRKAQLVPPITEPDGEDHDSELGKKRKVEPMLNLGRVCDEES
jgi:hypothetical protein